MKTRKLTQEERRKNLARGIYLIWTSLKTHLEYAVKTMPEMLEEGEDERFHAEAIREYAEVILICAIELEVIAPKRASLKKPTLSDSEKNTSQVGLKVPFPGATGQPSLPSQPGLRIEGPQLSSGSTQLLNAKS